MGSIGGVLIVSRPRWRESCVPMPEADEKRERRIEPKMVQTGGTAHDCCSPKIRVDSYCGRRKLCRGVVRLSVAVVFRTSTRSFTMVAVQFHVIVSHVRWHCIILSCHIKMLLPDILQ